MRLRLLPRHGQVLRGLVLGASITIASPAAATVLIGPMVNLPESSGWYCWGDGVHNLCQGWSYRTADSGWFYGTSYGWSNADIYVAHGLADPTTVYNAETFTYSAGVDWANEGDTVFFRGRNGYYGAWTIVRIDPQPGVPIPAGFLTGKWLFQTDGTGCFTGGCGFTPTHHVTWGSIKTIYR
jgi:hypothetical protein